MIASHAYVTNDYKSRGNIEDQVDQLMNRTFEPIPTAFLYGEVERTGFRNGETMDYVAWALVPRLLWPEKPNSTRGAWFTAYLLNNREGSVEGAIGETPVGELYWNFGFAGAIGGMTLIGMATGLLWRMIGKASGTRFGFCCSR